MALTQAEQDLLATICALLKYAIGHRAGMQSPEYADACSQLDQKLADVVAEQ